MNGLEVVGYYKKKNDTSQVSGNLLNGHFRDVYYMNTRVRYSCSKGLRTIVTLSRGL